MDFQVTITFHFKAEEEAEVEEEVTEVVVAEEATKAMKEMTTTNPKIITNQEEKEVVIEVVTEAVIEATKEVHTEAEAKTKVMRKKVAPSRTPEVDSRIMSSESTIERIVRYILLCLYLICEVVEYRSEFYTHAT